ncbi:Helicase associated domain protein [Streptomyces sp. NPDC056921]|uniref:Helicase associated domain protein n=1 Tax=Streptomyces sp. NPDC056921 TaxID=3345966 RepID=UPI00363E8B0E
MASPGLWPAGRASLGPPALQVLADPAGRLIWASDALPGAVHDLTAARTHGIPAALAADDVKCWADKAYQDAGPAVRVPFRGKNLRGWRRRHNRDRAKIRSLGERALATPKWLLENVLGIEPAEEAEQPVRRTQDDMWALNLRAAQQFHAREGHLRVPRKHVEHLAGTAQGTAGPGGHQAGADEVVVVKLGTWLDNVRKRADRLTEQRRADLDALGMRW